MTSRPQPLHYSITLAVLAAARDAGDQMVIAACKRELEADRRGYRKHSNPADRAIVELFAQ